MISALQLKNKYKKILNQAALEQKQVGKCTQAGLQFLQTASGMHVGEDWQRSVWARCWDRFSPSSFTPLTEPKSVSSLPGGEQGWPTAFQQL